MPIQQSGTRSETYTYRNDGQLETVSVSENGAAARQQAAFEHDAMGRVTRQIDYTKTLAGTVVTAWQRDVSYNGKGQVESETVPIKSD